MPAHNIRIRMYRPGFGDCFLITFYAGKAEHHVLMDCGVWHGADLGKMADIVTDIETETSGILDVLIATHAHEDHVSGYGQFARRFRKMKIGKIWLPWTENPQDLQAAKLRKRRAAAKAEAHRARKLAHSDPLSAAAKFALSNVAKEEAMQELTGGFGKPKSVRYWASGQKLTDAAGIPGLDVEFHGPPKNESLLGKMNPPASQRYLADLNGGALADLNPFPGLPKSRPPAHRPLPYYLSQLEEIAASVSEGLALQLDNVLNNTSLVMVFRFHGKTLLFPGDAQYGNWLNWMNTEDATRIFASLDFLKISHHASSNATPKLVVETLKKGQTAMMVPTQNNVYNEIPRVPLLTALAAKAKGIVRSDQVVIPKAPKGPATAMPKGFKKGKLSIDYVL